MNGLILIGAFVLAAGVTWVANRLALNPWRRSRHLHWSEQARLLYPGRMAARSNLWSIPATLLLSTELLWPDSLLWALVGIVSVLGAFAGTIPMEREILPRISSRELLWLFAITFLMRLAIWFLVVGAAVLMPDEFDSLALGLGGMVIGLWVIWSLEGFIWAGKKFGLFQSAPERLRKIAADTSARMNVPFRKVLLMRVPLAQAFALPTSRKLLFTQRLLDLLPDDEVAAICAHELAHLTEPRRARYSRSILMLAFLPWAFFNPLVHACGLVAFFGLCGMTVGAPVLYRKISRKLESRADQMAKANEGDAGTYARALTRLYQDSLVPAVSPKNRATHPHLYDRILAAGVTPDFARPLPARSIAWHGRVFAGVTGLLFAIVVIRYLQVLNMPG